MNKMQRTINDICDWWRIRRLKKFYPEWAARGEQLAQARRRHGRTKALEKQHQAFMTDLLRGPKVVEDACYRALVRDLAR